MHLLAWVWIAVAQLLMHKLGTEHYALCDGWVRTPESAREPGPEPCQTTGVLDLVHELLPVVHIPPLEHLLPVWLVCLTWRQPRFWREVRLVLLLRSLTALVTILPPCRDEVPAQVLPDVLWPEVSRWLAPVCCGGNYDKVFSGHVSFVVLTTRNLGWSTRRVYLLTCVQAALLLLGRMHYSVDVVLAVVISELVHGRG